MPDATAPIVVWRFTDGRRGHENQTEGLVAALARLVDLDAHTVPAPASGRLRALAAIASGTSTRGLPAPDLLVGAGHATHLPMLAARWRHGGRAVVLMRPTLPLRWFDLCLVPEHDATAPAPNVIETRGALTRVRPADERVSDEGLILIGGPSRHTEFDVEAVRTRIASIVHTGADVRWRAVESRRTPEGFVQSLAALGGVQPVPFESVDAQWLPAALGRAGCAWVTEDSASMVYEAVSAGAATGVIEVRADGSRGTDRVARGLERLRAAGLVTFHSEWREGRAIAPPGEPLDEAARCARWIRERWLGAPA